MPSQNTRKKMFVTEELKQDETDRTYEMFTLEDQSELFSRTSLTLVKRSPQPTLQGPSTLLSVTTPNLREKAWLLSLVWHFTIESDHQPLSHLFSVTKSLPVDCPTLTNCPYTYLHYRTLPQTSQDFITRPYSYYTQTPLDSPLQPAVDAQTVLDCPRQLQTYCRLLQTHLHCPRLPQTA